MSKTAATWKGASGDLETPAALLRKKEDGSNVTHSENYCFLLNIGLVFARLRKLLRSDNPPYKRKQEKYDGINPTIS